jgi:hypothetical protein
MSAGYLRPQAVTLPISGSTRVVFSIGAGPYVSFQVRKSAGTTDATYAVFTSNFSNADVPLATGNGSAPLTGSAPYFSYYSREIGMSGTLFTGSATDPPAAATVHLGSINAAYMAVELSSSAGGTLTVFPHIKTGH